MDYGDPRLLRKARGRARATAVNRYPDSAILRYTSCETKNEEVFQDQWVCARFSPHPGQEQLLVLGDESGQVTLGNATLAYNWEAFTQHSFRADERGSVLMDVGFISARPNLLVTLSGGGDVRVWDMGSGSATGPMWTQQNGNIRCVGHEACARCFASWAENPNCFVTGSRDGSVIVWDLRTQRTAKSRSYLPARHIPMTHPPPGLSTSSSSRKRQRQRSASTGQKSFGSDHKTVTAVLCTDENHFLSASAISATGIRLWDMRYQKLSQPVRAYDVPQRRQSGVSSLCMDRHKEKLFAATTDNCIYEYALRGKSIEPVSTLQGTSIKTCYVQCRASPAADYLLCGSSQGCAYIWDLQETHHYLQDDLSTSKLLGYSLDKRHLPFPKFRFNGHRQEVCSVDWSQPDGRYIVTVDEKILRVWNAWEVCGGGSSKTATEPESVEDDFRDEFNHTSDGEIRIHPYRATLGFNGNDYHYTQVPDWERLERPECLPEPSRGDEARAPKAK